LNVVEEKKMISGDLLVILIALASLYLALAIGYPKEFRK
jgi:hypothetical protein